MTKRYSKEFKVEAIALLRTPGMTVAKAARDLGVAESQIYKWRKAVEAHGATAFPGKGNLLPHDDEIRRLKRENEQLRMERDILKKAAYFSRDIVRG